MRWNSGTMNYLWNDFKQNAQNIMGSNHGDQDWITSRAKGDTNWWPEEWLRSYKWEMIGLGYKAKREGPNWTFNTPPKIAPENRVAVFHGMPKPFNCKDKFITDNWK